MTEVWIVQGGTGQWEDYYTWVAGVFSTEDKAKEFAEKANAADRRREEEMRVAAAAWEAEYQQANDQNDSELWERHPGYYEGSTYRVTGTHIIDAAEVVE